MDKLEILVDETLSDCRVDRALTVLSGLSRSRLQKLIEQGQLLRNGCLLKKSDLLVLGDQISLLLPDPTQSLVLPEKIPLTIVYEDDCMLVVEKPKGMVVHPAPGNPDGTLVNALLYACDGRLSSIGGVIRPGIVHRIDKDTSGLLMVAKTDAAHLALSEQIATHRFFRSYRTVAHGHFREPEGTITFPIGRSQKDRKKQAVNGINPREAESSYRVLEEYREFSELSVTLKTGRTHQIRVHLAAVGHPVAGDSVYGPKNGVKSLSGQCLHAQRLGFYHPKSGEYMEFSSPLPDYFTQFLKTLPR